MLLAVAGQDQDAITERTRRLASGDWSKFPASDQAAFAFARKQARQPWTIGDKDVEELRRHFGAERSLDVIWWACRCHYMTRVADAFQLPLEGENVFQPPASKKP
jgi:alkylhydroperoxidase family enzyme